MARQLRRADIDPDEVGHRCHGPGGVHIVVRWPQFSPQRQHHVGFRDQCPHSLKARAGRDTQWVLMQQAPGVDGLDHGCIEPLCQRRHSLCLMPYPAPGEDHHALRRAQLLRGAAKVAAIIRQRLCGLWGPRIGGCEGRSSDVGHQAAGAVCDGGTG